MALTMQASIRDLMEMRTEMAMRTKRRPAQDINVMHSASGWKSVTEIWVHG